MKTFTLLPLKPLLAAAVALLLGGWLVQHTPTNAEDVPAVPDSPAASPAKAETTPTPAADATEPPADEEAVPLQKVSGPQHQVSPELAEIIELVEAGVGEEAILAFIEKSNKSYPLSADDILYLNDLGVSAEIIAALLRHQGSAPTPSAGTPAPASTQPAPPAQAAAETSPPAPGAVAGVAPQPIAQTPPPEAPAAESPPPPAPQPPPAQVNYNYYYSYLAPYGSWYIHPTWGWCWTPTVAIAVAGWRPYCHNGYWLYTDCGWYWHSYYSWGWVPFHYGRWFRHHGRWFWTPGSVWGPAWVSWRWAPDYCGWAPLPPSAGWSVGIGLTHVGKSVGVSFGFGLAADHFTFVSWGRFRERDPWRHRLDRRDDIVHIYNRSTVVNNYIVGKDHTVINEGVGRDRVATFTRSEVRKVRVEDLRPVAGTDFRGEQLDPSRGKLLVYRPNIPAIADAKASPAARAEVQKARALGTPALARAAEPSPIIFPTKPYHKRVPEATVEARGLSSRLSSGAPAQQAADAVALGRNEVRTSPQPSTPAVTPRATVQSPRVQEWNKPRVELTPSATKGIAPSAARAVERPPAAPVQTPAPTPKYEVPKVSSGVNPGITPQTPTTLRPSTPTISTRPSTPKADPPRSYSAPANRWERSTSFEPPALAVPPPSPPPSVRRELPKFSPAPPQSVAPPQVTPSYDFSRPSVGAGPSVSRPVAPQTYQAPAGRPAPSYAPPAAPRAAPIYSAPPAPRTIAPSEITTPSAPISRAPSRSVTVPSNAPRNPPN